MRDTWKVLWLVSVVACAASPARAQTEGAEGAEGAEAEPTPPPGPPPTLPAPTLEEEPPIAPEPSAEEEEEGPHILYRIRMGDHPEWEDDAAGEPPADVAFEVPGDARTQQQSNQIRLPQEDTNLTPPVFGIGVGAGWARLLGMIPFDFFRLEQRFEARIPDFPALRVGAGVAELIAESPLVGGGVRIGLGANFCDASWVKCEGVAIVQPGVMGGDLIGVVFDLHAALDLRFWFPRMFELVVSGGYSLLGETSMFHLTGQGAIVF